LQGSFCSTKLQNFWAGTYVIFQVGVGTKRKNLRISYGPNQKEAHGPGTTPAERETRVRHQGSQMHEAMGVVLNPINSSCRYAVARFIGSTLHFDCSTHGSSRLALRPSLLNTEFCGLRCASVRHLCVSGRYTASRVASYHVRFLAADEGCSLAHFEIRILRNVLNLFFQNEERLFSTREAARKDFSSAYPDNFFRAASVLTAIHAGDGTDAIALQQRHQRLNCFLLVQYFSS